MLVSEKLMLFNHKRADFGFQILDLKDHSSGSMFEGLFVTMATNLPSYFYSIFRTTPEVSSKFYFVEIC